MIFDRKKDKVSIIAPASGIRDAAGNMDVEQSYEDLEFIVGLYKEHGFDCIYDENIFIKTLFYQC